MPPIFLLTSLRSQTGYLDFVAWLSLIWAYSKAEIRLHLVSARINRGGNNLLAHDDVNFCVHLTGKRTGSLKTIQVLNFVYRKAEKFATLQTVLIPPR